MDENDTTLIVTYVNKYRQNFIFHAFGTVEIKNSDLHFLLLSFFLVTVYMSYITDVSSCSQPSRYHNIFLSEYLINLLLSQFSLSNPWGPTRQQQHSVRQRSPAYHDTSSERY